MNRSIVLLCCTLLLAAFAKDAAKGAEKRSASGQAAGQVLPSAPTVCPTFGGGLYVLLDQVPLAQASALCLSAGYGLANLTFSNNFVASQLLVQCGAGLGWISSFETVRSNTCVVLTGDGNVFFPGGPACQTQRQAVICQDFAAVLTDTTTATFTTCTTSVETDTVVLVSTSTSTIVSTTTSTGSMKRLCPDCVQTRTVFLPGGVTTVTQVTSSTATVTLQEKAGAVVRTTLVPTTTVSVEQLPDKKLVVVGPKDQVAGEDGAGGGEGEGVSQKSELVDCPMNVPACQGQGESGEFVVLRTYLSFERAACSCRKLGMQLAAINSHNIHKARAALEQCAGGYFEFPAWIRSWQGDVYAKSTCLSLTNGGAINAQGSCQEGLPVLCQRTVSGNVFLAQQDPVYSLCSTTQNNLFIVSSQAYLAGQDPAVACGAFNLLPANVFDNTRAAAAAVFSVCAAGDPNAVAAQANSFDGLQGAACNLVDDTQAVLVVDNTNGDVAQNCFVNQRYFLCQVRGGQQTASISTVFTGPYFLVTTTTVRTPTVTTIFRTTSITVSTGTTVRTTEVELISLALTTITSTTTTTIKITSAVSGSSTTTITTGQSSAATTVTVTNQSTVTVTSCPTTVAFRCPFMSKSAGMIVLTDALPYSQAECACKQHGLRLAELSVASFAEAAAVEFDCLGGFQKAWIKGYSGSTAEDSRQCTALYVGGEKGGNGAAALPLYCDVRAPVLCQQV